MEIKISTKSILNFLYVLAWIIFVGICIEVCGLLFNTFFIIGHNPLGPNAIWEGADLSSLYAYDMGYFLVETLLTIIPAILKALMFYLIVKILHSRLDITKLFSETVRRFIVNLAYLSLGIGLFSFWGVNYTQWLVKQGVKMPDLQQLHLAGADVWLFMAVTLFVISQIFKRGIEIQDEHELTV
ncbi:MAG: hypothetical protein V4663_09595 [Bacteroidota bacterium]